VHPSSRPFVQDLPSPRRLGSRPSALIRIINTMLYKLPALQRQVRDLESARLRSKLSNNSRSGADTEGMAIRRGIRTYLVFGVCLSFVACAGGGGEGVSSGDGDADAEQVGDEMEVGEVDVDAPTRELCENRTSEQED